MESINGPVITDIMHPLYSEEILDYLLYRFTFFSGRRYINEYLRPFSAREDLDDFKNRTFNSYCPAFAKKAVTDIISKIYSQFYKIVRTGGTKSYQSSVL